MRWLDLPADSKHRVHDDLHDFKDGRDLSKHLDAMSKRYYGAVGRSWLERLAADQEAAVEFLREKSEVFSNKVAPPNDPGIDPTVRRVADQLGLVAAAGELATKYGITGWTPGTAMQATEVMFARYIAGREAGTGSQDRIQMLQKLEHLMEINHDHLLQYHWNTVDKHWELGERNKNKPAWGEWYNDKTHGEVITLTPSGMREFVKGSDISLICECLAEDGIALPGERGKPNKDGKQKQRYDKRMKPPNRSKQDRRYAFSITKLREVLEKTQIVAEQSQQKNRPYERSERKVVVGNFHHHRSRYLPSLENRGIVGIPLATRCLTTANCNPTQSQRFGILGINPKISILDRLILSLKVVFAADFGSKNHGIQRPIFKNSTLNAQILSPNLQIPASKPKNSTNSAFAVSEFTNFDGHTQ